MASCWCRNIVSYWSVVGLATKSSRYEQSMNQHLMLMTESTSKSIALTGLSSENEELAATNSQQAAVDKTQSAELQEESMGLLKRSEVDLIKANADEVEMDSLKTEIGIEEEEMAGFVAEATADEITYETEIAEGTADASEAFELEAEVHGEEIGVTVCEFIPLLDMICDVVGSGSIVGLEVTATAEAAKSAGEMAAAATAKADEDRNAALATEMEARITEDNSVASGLQEEESSLREKAEKERIEGEQKQVASKTLYEQAEVEEAMAPTLEEQATQEETSASDNAAKALSHGVISCWDAILATVSGVTALVFFGFRFITAHVVPVVTKSCSTNPASTTSMRSNNNDKKRYFDILKSTSCFIQHWIIFLVVIGTFSLKLLPTVVNTNTVIKARGGVIILFGCVCSSIEIVFLRAIPEFYDWYCIQGRGEAERDCCYSIFAIISRFLTCAILFILELLILWVAFGQNNIVILTRVDALSSVWFKIVCGVILACHIILVEFQILSGDKLKRCDEQQLANISSQDNGQRATSDGKICTARETDSLLPTDCTSQPFDACTNGQQTTPTTAVLWNKINRGCGVLQLRFDLLVLICMVSLTRHCLPWIIHLWPTTKNLLLASRPDWLVPSLVILVLLVCLYTTLPKCRNYGAVRTSTDVSKKNKCCGGTLKATVGLK